MPRKGLDFDLYLFKPSIIVKYDNTKIDRLIINQYLNYKFQKQT